MENALSFARFDAKLVRFEADLQQFGDDIKNKYEQKEEQQDDDGPKTINLSKRSGQTCRVVESIKEPRNVRFDTEGGGAVEALNVVSEDAVLGVVCQERVVVEKDGVWAKAKRVWKSIKLGRQARK